ncbi:hypothetical protein Gorai_006194, partial [Gossypium raimondii]|nr:hypothetical protein [Gossypium raimondii]
MKAGLDLGFRRVVMEVDTLSIMKKTCRNGKKTAHAVAREAVKINENTYLEGQLPRLVLKEAKTDVRELERRSSGNVNKNKKYLKKEERLVFAKARKKFLELKG